jgi:hypothetical protein
MDSIGSISKETLGLMKGGLSGGRDWLTGKPLEKGVSISTGLTWYDLQAPSKNLYPQITPIRNSLPRVKRKDPGPAAHWISVDSIVGSGWDSMGWVPEGQRSGTMGYNTSNHAFTYVTIGEEDYLTFEAEAAAEGFEDENAMVTFRLLQKMMQKEEKGLLGGNAGGALGSGGIALGTCNTPTVSSVADTNSTLPTATYKVQCVELTFEGYKNSTLAAGVATQKTIVGADGKSFVLNGGAGQASAESAGQGVTSGTNHLVATVTPKSGAVAWAWFISSAGGSGNETLQQITYVPWMIQSVALVAGRQTAASITSDYSANSNYAFNGLITTAFSYGTYGGAGTAYVTYLSNPLDGSAGKGVGFTASGRGSVVEIDNALKAMWDNNRLGPTVMYVNSQEQQNITSKCLTNASGPLLRYEVPTTPGQAYGIVAGGVIDYYYNPFTPDGGYKLPVKLHPDVPPGTVLFWCERLPTWYQSNNVPNVAEVLLRRDYYRMDWPLRTRQREYGVYAEEVLGIYAPFAMGIITGVANL